jgi:spermidine/putrescine transport system substrate-binding protein
MQDPKTKRHISENELEGLVTEVARGRISRKQFLGRAAALGLSAGAIGSVLAACNDDSGGGGGASASPEPVVSTAKPDKLFLYNWSDYMTNKCKKDYQKQSGIEVVETYYDDNEALLTKLQAGARGYDIIVPSDYMVHILIKTGLLEPLDMSLIPNHDQYVDPKFQNPEYDNPEENGGNKYSIPYQWGTTGYAVRVDTFKDPVSKWADLWNEAYKGQIQMLNDERETMGVGLMKNGYSINSTSEEEVTKAKDDLIVQKPLVRAYDSTAPKRAMVQGVPLVHCWNGDVVVALWAGLTPEQINYVMPEEAFPIYVDCLCTPVGAPSRYWAHDFMNYVLDPATQGPLSTWIGYFTPVTSAVPDVDPIVYTFAPTEEDLERGEIYNDLGNFSRVYTEAWAEVKSS